MVFVGTAVFTRRVRDYLDDDDYAVLQSFLADRPEAGKIIKHSGGIRKIGGEAAAGGSEAEYA